MPSAPKRSPPSTAHLSVLIHPWRGKTRLIHDLSATASDRMIDFASTWTQQTRLRRKRIPCDHRLLRPAPQAPRHRRMQPWGVIGVGDREGTQEEEHEKDERQHQQHPHHQRPRRRRPSARGSSGTTEGAPPHDRRRRAETAAAPALQQALCSTHRSGGTRCSRILFAGEEAERRPGAQEGKDLMTGSVFRSLPRSVFITE